MAKANTKLFDVCKSGNLKQVKKLVDAGADVNATNQENSHPLYLATQEKHTNVVQYLLSKGADVNAKNKDDETTALHCASEYGLLDIMQLLVEAGADVNMKNKEQHAPLFVSTIHNKLDCVKYLLSKGADANGKNEINETSALIEAGYYNLFDIAKALIEAGADVNQQNKKTAPLRTASARGSLDIVKLLVEAGADINMISGQNEGNAATALAAASYEGKVAVVDYLLSKSADVNIKIKNNTTALIFACKAGHFDVVQSLVQAGADVNARSDLHNPLMSAIFSKNVNIVSYLISKGIDLNITISNITPVYYATALGNLDIVKELVNGGADFTQKSNTYFSPLHMAVKNNYKDIVAFLLSKGVDVNDVYGKHNKTVLFLACEQGHLDIVKLLVAAGADLHATTTDGKTAYDIAISKNHQPIVAYLDTLTPKWKGFTQSDISKFDTLFELDMPAGQQFPPANDWSTCPVCLKYVPRGPGCMYMTHNCSAMGGFYHKQLYDKYKNEIGLIEWCTICGRISDTHHNHYELGLANDKKPKAITKHHNPFSNDCRDANGGGGLPEKFKRIRRLREIALELQDEVGKITEQEAFTALVEETWNAPLSRSFKVPKIMAERKWNIPVNAFPPNVQQQQQQAANQGNYNKPEAYMEPIVRVPGDDRYKGDEGALDDTIPSIQFRHKKADGTMNEDHEQIGLESLIVFIDVSGDKKGKCFDMGCQGLLWPREIEQALANPALGTTQAQHDRVTVYKSRFNGWHAEGAIGGRYRRTHRHLTANRRKQTCCRVTRRRK